LNPTVWGWITKLQGRYFCFYLYFYFW